MNQQTQLVRLFGSHQILIDSFHASLDEPANQTNAPEFAPNRWRAKASPNAVSALWRMIVVYQNLEVIFAGVDILSLLVKITRLTSGSVALTPERTFLDASEKTKTKNGILFDDDICNAQCKHWFLIVSFHDICAGQLRIV